jgi:Ribonuclease G/E
LILCYVLNVKDGKIYYNALDQSYNGEYWEKCPECNGQGFIISKTKCEKILNKLRNDYEIENIKKI